jgi:hypothetical protein
LGAADVASLLLDDDLAEEAARQGLSIQELSTPQKPSRAAREDQSQQQQQQSGGVLNMAEVAGSNPQQGLGVRFLGSHSPATAVVAGAEGGMHASPADAFTGMFGGAAAAVGGVGAQLPPLPPLAAAAAGGLPAASFKRRGVGRPPGSGRGGRGSRGGMLGRPPGPGRGRGRPKKGGGSGLGGDGLGSEGWM